GGGSRCQCDEDRTCTHDGSPSAGEGTRFRGHFNTPIMTWAQAAEKQGRTERSERQQRLQIGLGHLAHRVAREGLDEANPLRNLVVRHPPAAPFSEPVRVYPGTVPPRDEGG